MCKASTGIKDSTGTLDLQSLQTMVEGSAASFGALDGDS
jgi:hypothetical protein